jgi:hypothetical protein
MDMNYFWRCTSPITGKRYSTRWRMTEVEARKCLIDPERVEYGALAVGPITGGGHSMPSGLVRRADGAMMPPEVSSSPCPELPTTTSPP